MDEPWADIARTGERVLSLSEKYSPDVVHLNGYTLASLPFGCRKLVVAHSCVLSWWQSVKREPAPARYDRYRRAVTAGLQAADVVVAPSNAMLRALQKIYGLERGVVIPNATSDVAPTGVPKQDFVFSAGRSWDEAKNLRALAAVAGALSVPVYVAGKDSERLPGVSPLGELGTTEMKYWFARAAIYVAPALYEPFGLAILEAAIHGAALVLGDIESLREVWADAAIYVAPDDAPSLRGAIELLVHDHALRVAMAERARHRAKHYSIADHARSYLKLYGRLQAGEELDAPGHQGLRSTAHCEGRGACAS